MTKAAEPTMLDLMGILWTRDHTAAALGLTDDELDSATIHGELLRLTGSDGGEFYPLFQFAKTPTGGVAVHPVIQAILVALAGHDPWTIAILLNTPAPELDDLTPLAAIRADRTVETLRGFTDAVIAEMASPAS